MTAEEGAAMLLRLTAKFTSYSAFNWRPLLAAHAAGYAIQAAVYFALVGLGTSGLVALVAAKGVSWAAFLWQLVR
jgi:hypothetical protein